MYKILFASALYAIAFILVPREFRIIFVIALNTLVFVYGRIKDKCFPLVKISLITALLVLVTAMFGIY